MSLFQLVYLSQAARPMRDEDFVEIQRVARARNHNEGITGLLLHSRGHFVQMLEGPPALIAQLYSDISRDPRHREHDCVLFGPTEARVYSDWSMGVLNLDCQPDKNTSDRLWHELGTALRAENDRRESVMGAFRSFETLLGDTEGSQKSVA